MRIEEKLKQKYPDHYFCLREVHWRAPDEAFLRLTVEGGGLSSDASQRSSPIEEVIHARGVHSIHFGVDGDAEAEDVEVQTAADILEDPLVDRLFPCGVLKTQKGLRRADEFFLAFAKLLEERLGHEVPGDFLVEFFEMGHWREHVSHPCEFAWGPLPFLGDLQTLLQAFEIPATIHYRPEQSPKSGVLLRWGHGWLVCREAILCSESDEATQH